MGEYDLPERIRPNALAIYDDETPMGMGLYYDCPDLESYNFSQLFIDERYQGGECGRGTVELVLDAMGKDGKYQKVWPRRSER